MIDRRFDRLQHRVAALTAGTILTLLPALAAQSAGLNQGGVAPSLPGSGSVHTLKQGGQAPALNQRFTPRTRHMLTPTQVLDANGRQRTLGLPGATQVSIANAAAKSKPEYKEGEVLVLFKQGINASAANHALDGQGMAMIKPLGGTTGGRNDQVIALARGPAGMRAEALMKRLKADTRVQAVSLNYIKRPTAVADPCSGPHPNDSFFERYQWPLCNEGQTDGTPDADIDATEAWEFHTGDSDDVVMAVIDTGVDYNHPDLRANMWVNPGETAGNGVDDDGNGYVDDIHGINTADDKVSSAGDPSPTHWHGTHVAGIMAAEGNNQLGVAGVNWTGRIMAIQGFEPGGEGMSDSAELEALDYVLEMKRRGVNIVAVNASYGCVECYNEILEDKLADLGAAGIVFVAAAGNDGADNDAVPHYPSSYAPRNIISVAATDHNDALSWFSNYGIESVDLGAPGESIISTAWQAWYQPGEGTEVFFDNVEGDLSNWTAVSPWAATEEQAFSGGLAWSDSPNGNYANGQTALLYSPVLDLSGQTGPLSLGFSLNFDLEPYDEETEKWGDYLHIFYYRASGSDNTVSWQITTEQASSDSHAWSDSPGGNYDNSTSSGILSKPFDLSGLSAFYTQLEFSVIGEIEAGSEDWDRLHVHCTSDSETWQYLGYISGQHSSWTRYSVVLPSDCISATSRVLFNLVTDGSVTYDGYYIDDIVVRDILLDPTISFEDDMESGDEKWTTFAESTQDEGEYEYRTSIQGSSEGEWLPYNIAIPEDYFSDSFHVLFVLSSDDSITRDGVYLDDIGVGVPAEEHAYYGASGTSMAAPHVTGAVGFVAGLHPDESMLERKERILSSGDAVPALSGTTATGRRLNLFNAAIDQADLSLAMETSTPEPTVDELFRLTLALTNAGPHAAQDVQVAITPSPSYFQDMLVSAEPASGSYDDEIDTGYWTLDSLDPGQTVMLNFEIVSETAQSVSLTAEVTASSALDPDSTPANDDASEDDYAAVQFEIQDEPEPFEPCQGDLNADGAVDQDDMPIFASAFGSTSSDQRYNAMADFDEDGDVDGTDLGIFRANFGRTDCAVIPAS